MLLLSNDYTFWHMQRVQGHDMVSLLLDLDWNAKSSLEFTKENHKNRFSPPGLPSVFEKNQLQIELPGIYILAATMIQAVCFVSHLWLLCFLQEKRVVSVGNFRIEIQWLHPFSSPFLSPPPPPAQPLVTRLNGPTDPIYLYFVFFYRN